MSLNEATLKRQLGYANENLTARVKVLDSQGVPAANRRKDAAWRKLNAACNTIRTRLKAVETIKTRDEEVAKRKAEKETAADEPKVSKKGAKDAKGGKTPKPEKAAKEPKSASKEKEAGGRGEKKTEAKEKKKKD